MILRGWPGFTPRTYSLHARVLPKAPPASLFKLTLQAPLDLLDHKVQVAEQVAWQPGPIVEPSLVLGPTQN